VDNPASATTIATLTANFDNAIRAFVEQLAAEESGFTGLYDYRIEAHRTDGTVESLIFKSDPRDPSQG
jgi:hypothetical protein